MSWVKLPCDEHAAFAALSLRARGLHATLWRRQRDGVLDAIAHDVGSLAREIARRLGATAGDRRWLADELESLVRSGYLARRGESWVLVASDERPEPNANVTRTEHEPNANTTRTLHEPNTKSDASARNHSTAETPSPDLSLRREDLRGEGARTREPARTREGQPAAGGWWLDPWAVVNRLRERSQGRINLVLNGHERALSAVLAASLVAHPNLGELLDRWADLAGRGEASWWQGAWTLGALLGKADERGHRAGDGFTRCLAETAARMPKSKPAAALRVVPAAAPVELISPERAREKVEAARRERAARAAAEAAAAREVANG